MLFHNGEAVTAEDVIYSFETCAETTVDTALAAALSSVEDISAEGSTVTITLSEANPDFLSYVGMVYIVPAAYDQQDTAPVGTGPFQFVSRSVQENLVLEKFGDYWGCLLYTSLFPGGRFHRGSRRSTLGRRLPRSAWLPSG